MCILKVELFGILSFLVRIQYLCGYDRNFGKIWGNRVFISSILNMIENKIMLILFLKF